MLSIKDIELFLPKYLSPESEDKLFKDLNSFPGNIDDRLYVSNELEPDLIYQGDGLNNLLVINLPDQNIKKLPCMVLSNTCDINLENRRQFRSNIVYSPIIKLDKYRDLLVANGIYDAQSIESHLITLKNQRITQIFYLPIGMNLGYEGLIFFDRLVSCDNESIDRGV